jgi:hypothetical protein
VIIGVIAVQVMQVTVMDEIDMGAVLDAHMLFAGMAVLVVIAGDGGAEFLGLRIGGADLDDVFVDMAVMPMVQVTIMQEVDMAGMFKRLVAAALAMGVAVVAGMQHFMRHDRSGQERECQRGEKKGPVHFVSSTSNDPATALRPFGG